MSIVRHSRPLGQRVPGAEGEYSFFDDYIIFAFILSASGYYRACFRYDYAFYIFSDIYRFDLYLFGDDCLSECC